MVNKLYTCLGNSFNPYENLALEEVLLRNVPKNSCILYLWQNQRTVVVGKNQNAWKECRVKELEEDGGHLARRLSGGGAVFHDLGNLNFTFLVNTDDYDLEKQLDVILRAVNSLGIKALKSGRNDIITEDGRKFSGNAFYHNGGKSYHHGTLMMHVDKELVERYLNVSKLKLSSKGVSSVKSRVVNLIELNPDITVDLMNKALFKAFEAAYGLPSEEFVLTEKEKEEVERLKERNASFEWRLGRKIAFDWKAEQRFSWGSAEIDLKVESGHVKEAAVYSDAMDGDFLKKMTPFIVGHIFSAKEIADAIAMFGDAQTDTEHIHMVNDIEEYISSQEF